MNYFMLFSGVGNCSFALNKLMDSINDLPDVGGLGKPDFRISSMEVAKAAKKRHSDVLRDIRTLISQGVQERNFAFSFIIKELHNGAKRKYPVCMLTKKGVLILTSGYSAKLREAVINRWEELEKQRIAEERDPSLSVSKAVEAWKRQGKSDQWITTRTQSIVQRRTYTDTLQAHGVENEGYAQCTNAIYRPILGGTKGKVAKERGVPAKANFRDTLSGLELAAVTLSEYLAVERIERHDSSGNDQCAHQSGIAATNVSNAIKASRK